MNRSEQIADLVTALAKAQATIPSIKRDKRAEIKSDKGSYSYSYADLATIMDAIRQPLSEQGLAIIQSVETGDGLVVVETMLAHSSGQWVSHQIGLKAGGDARSVGSAITYARRYGLNLTGVVTEDDDDGERASEHGAAVAPKRTSSATSTQKCPKCGGAMWDNRETKTNPRAPDYKCKDKSCDGAIWQPADPAPPGNGHAPEPKPEAAGWEEVEAGTSPVRWKSWKSPAQAVAWGVAQGCFEHPNHANNAYDALKKEINPTTAAQMFEAWQKDVERRCAEKQQPEPELFDDAQEA